MILRLVLLLVCMAATIDADVIVVNAFTDVGSTTSFTVGAFTTMRWNYNSVNTYTVTVYGTLEITSQGCIYIDDMNVWGNFYINGNDNYPYNSVMIWSTGTMRIFGKMYIMSSSMDAYPGTVLYSAGTVDVTGTVYIINGGRNTTGFTSAGMLNVQMGAKIYIASIGKIGLNIPVGVFVNVLGIIEIASVANTKGFYNLGSISMFPSGQIIGAVNLGSGSTIYTTSTTTTTTRPTTTQSGTPTLASTTSAPMAASDTTESNVLSDVEIGLVCIVVVAVIITAVVIVRKQAPAMFHKLAPLPDVWTF